MSVRRRKIIITVMLLFMLVFLFYNTNAIGRLMYPIHFAQDIAISAANYNLDPLLIAAVIRTESKYKPELESAKKAVGLMQIMPETAEWIIERAQFNTQMKDHLKQPAVNIELGAWYLQWLENRYDGQLGYEQSDEDLIAVIAASYNAGHNKVTEWIREDVWDGRYETRNQIPYGETRHYIKRVIYYYHKYKAFYVGKSIELIAQGKSSTP